MTAGRWQHSSESASSTALRQFDAALREQATRVVDAPVPIPSLIAALERWNVNGAVRAMLPAAVLAAEQAVYRAPGRDVEMRALWRAALATCVAAWQLAQHTADARAHRDWAAEVALGGLLYRAGAARLLAAVAQHESASGSRLHAALRRQIEQAHEAHFRDALLTAWNLPRVAALAASGWRAALDAPAATGGMQLVYLAQLLASEALQPQFCPPALAAGVAERLRVDARRLQTARAAISLLA